MTADGWCKTRFSLLVQEKNRDLLFATYWDSVAFTLEEMFEQNPQRRRYGVQSDYDTVPTVMESKLMSPGKYSVVNTLAIRIRGLKWMVK